MIEEMGVKELEVRAVEIRKELEVAKSQPDSEENRCWIDSLEVELEEVEGSQQCLMGWWEVEMICAKCGNKFPVSGQGGDTQNIVDFRPYVEFCVEEIGEGCEECGHPKAALNRVVVETGEGKVKDLRGK